MDGRVSDRTLTLYSRGAIVCLVVAEFARGATRVDPSRLQATRLLSVLLFATSLAFWCAVDASKRRRDEVWCAQWQYMTTWPVSVPVYLIQTRRWKAIPVLLVALLVFGAVELGGAALVAVLSP